MIFLRNKIDFPDEQMEASFGHCIFSRQNELILAMIKPEPGERVLDMGGKHMPLFREKQCMVTGFIPSVPDRVSLCEKSSADGLKLYTGDTEDLPFSDDEFDVVAVINVLDASRNPQKLIAEAIRVCCGRIFLSFFNKYSFVATQERLKDIFGFPSIDKVYFFSIEEVKEMIEALVGRESLKWSSVIYFPAMAYGVFTELEKIIPSRNNPFGACVGLTFPVKYGCRTVQSPVISPYKLKRNNRVTAPEAVRGMLQGGGR